MIPSRGHSCQNVSTPLGINRCIRFAVRLFAIILIVAVTIVSGHSGSPSHAADRVTTTDTFDVDEPVIALTFDVTFDRGDGAEILDILARYDVRATFAITGIWAELNPDLMQRIVAEGHGLMNHTWNHQSFTGEYTGSAIHVQTDPLSHQAIVDQLRRTEEIVERLTGVNMRPYVRPPYGDYDQQSLTAMADAGYTYNIMWTVDTYGWHMRPVNEVHRRALDAAQPGANILMHVGHGSTDGAALPGILEALIAQGYRFATVEEFVEGPLAPSEPEPLTAQSAADLITQAWRHHGGLLAYGLPITGVYEEKGSYVQYFQRARFALAPVQDPSAHDVNVQPIEASEVRDTTADRSGVLLAQTYDGRCRAFVDLDVRICGRLLQRWDDVGGSGAR
jgi:peptidoglycan-N-acetylglucosamine deacetylase